MAKADKPAPGAPKAPARLHASKAPPASTANRILNCLPSVGTASDWSFGDALMAGVVSNDLPLSHDLRAPWWEIGDQKQTGSCVGWATADSLLRWHLAKANRIDQADHLSVRFIWMAAKEFDELTTAPTTFIEQEGTTLKAALDVVRRYGAVLEAELPFSGQQLSADPASVFYAKAAQLKAASYLNLGTNPTSWRRWIANQGPVLTRLNVDQTWQAVQKDGKLAAYQPDTVQGGHAVALVGYDASGFIVRNSWGKGWGDGGYAYASEAYARDAFTEAYGVTLGEDRASGAASKANAKAADGAAAAAAPIDQIEAMVAQAAREIKNRPIHLGMSVEALFPDVRALDRLLGRVQDLANAGLHLTSRPTAEKLALLKGSLLDVADWALRVLS